MGARRYGLTTWVLSTLALSACGGDGPSSPTSEDGFGEIITLQDHAEVPVRFSSDGVSLTGTLYLPLGNGPFPAVVYVHGSGREPRMPYVNFPHFSAQVWVERGYAILAYDKRGVGSSGGTCCPVSDPSYFPLLGRDALSAVRLLRTHPRIRSERVGLYGFSQGGWVVPSAAAASLDVAFVVIGSGPATTLGEEGFYSGLTGECSPTELSEEEIDRRMEDAPRTGFNPAPDLRAMSQPGTFIQGLEDTSQPVRQTLQVLNRIRDEHTKDWNILAFPDADHVLLLDGGGCAGGGTPVDWLTPTFDWLASRVL